MASLLRVAALLALVALACAAPTPDGAADLTAAKEALQAQGVFSTYLKLLQASGFEPILARYIQTQPVTLLVPADKAFASLPLRVKSQLTGSKLIKLMEFHMILQKLPVAFLRMAQPGSNFRTVYGVNLVKHNTALKSTVIMGPPGANMASQMAVVTRGDIAAAKLLLLCVHGVSNVILPPNVFF
eukprot:TRINITY_DN32126_c0_g1_i1.p1 TRINITY_DN32126_c0_g1~~TRINITY_DN32126_c0_g1_i1.p1  ORF type:complete len:185 (+),score=19.34 TRINITY_DN32126_c0_g1_i1:316-870(+)